MGVGRTALKRQTMSKSSSLSLILATLTPTLSRKREREKNYAASAFAGFAGGVMAPDDLMSANSFAE